MSKQTRFICQQCGADYSKWQGKCLSCGSWNSLVEELVFKVGKNSNSGRSSFSIAKPETQLHYLADESKKIVAFSQASHSNAPKSRFSTMIGELDRVLGGGLVPGSVVLLGGEPGIGKSTLLTQALLLILANYQKNGQNFVSGQNDKQLEKMKILYIAGEESPSQISVRIRRFLENEQFFTDYHFDKISPEQLAYNLYFVTTNNVDEIVYLINKNCPNLIIVDSIQTLFTTDLSSTSGSLGQVRESADRILRIVKALHIPCFLVGHVNKEGGIAGPKILEHMVDAVLELSGERSEQLRLLRALKNRFGATDEVGVFRFVSFGLQEVKNPSELFVESRSQATIGSALSCLLEGSRPLLIEVQSLVINSHLAMPRRVGRGLELSRVQVLSAVLEKYCRLPMSNTDIFVSAVGGLKVKEPAIDLGLAVAMASSLMNKKVAHKTVFIGEIGLLGEIRPVTMLDKRIAEVKRLGYQDIVSSKTHQNIVSLLREMKIN